MELAKVCGIIGCSNEVSVYVTEVLHRRPINQNAFCLEHFQTFLNSIDSKHSVSQPPSASVAGDEILFDVELLCFFYRRDIHQGDIVQVHLREESGSRAIIIEIGYCEYSVLYHLLAGAPRSRPLTHQAMASTISSLQALLKDVVIDRKDEKEHHFSAHLRIEQGNRAVLVDVRPSDAISLALSTGAPIRVAESLLLSSG